jgi:hypothetical protein
MFSAAYERINVKYEFSNSQSVVADFRSILQPICMYRSETRNASGLSLRTSVHSTSEMSDARGLLLQYAEPVA